MDKSEINLDGKICPYPVIEIIETVEKMKAGETLTFCVDDPLAIKSVPDELEDRSDLNIKIETRDGGWNITISKQ